MKEIDDLTVQLLGEAQGRLLVHCFEVMQSVEERGIDPEHVLVAHCAVIVEFWLAFVGGMPFADLESKITDARHVARTHLKEVTAQVHEQLRKDMS